LEWQRCVEAASGHVRVKELARAQVLLTSHADSASGGSGKAKCVLQQAHAGVALLERGVVVVVLLQMARFVLPEQLDVVFQLPLQPRLQMDGLFALDAHARPFQVQTLEVHPVHSVPFISGLHQSVVVVFLHLSLLVAAVVIIATRFWLYHAGASTLVAAPDRLILAVASDGPCDTAHPFARATRDRPAGALTLCTPPPGQPAAR
jgi:hypothetical protein